MNINLDQISIVHWWSDVRVHHCGYCKNDDTSISKGMWAEELTVEDYQILIDRGWRRSGKYCYKPIMDQTCCPQYTIKCEALNFSITKSQKKVIKRFNKFLKDGQLKMDTQPELQDYPEECCKPNFEAVKPMKDQIEAGQIDGCVGRRQAGPDPNKPQCKKAKLMRLERKKEKNGVVSRKKTDNLQKSLEDFLGDLQNDSEHKFELKLVDISRPTSDWEQIKRLEFNLYQKYQTIVHNDRPSECTMSGFTRFLVSTPLKVDLIKSRIKLVEMSNKNANYKESFVLYKKYQTTIHGDSPGECDENTFNEFLVDTPLRPMKFVNDDEGALHYGSFHQQYWLDDKLIAVGVIDILPKCVSSVYFFYDPDYRNLTLGTYGALREIEFVRNLYQLEPSIEYYYMGFYIHSCPKMRYKGRLTPSYLLCPKSYEWFPIEDCLKKLDISKYAVLNDNPNATDQDECTPNDVGQMKIFYQKKLMLYNNCQNQLLEFNEFARLIGKKCSQTMLFVIIS